MRLVVFDVAGTTLRDDGDAVACAIVSVLAMAGVEVSAAEVDPVMGLVKPLAIATLLERHRCEAPKPEEVRMLHERFRAAMVEHYTNGPGVEAMPGAKAVFAALRQSGIKVALDTGFDRTILDAIIQRVGWGPLLDATIASDEVEHGRPHPDMIRTLMRRCEVERTADVCKVGDSLADIEEGIQARCGLVIAVRNRRTLAVLDRYPDVSAIDALDEVLGHIESRAGVVG
jgi:phosphonatase-like hydrolase